MTMERGSEIRMKDLFTYFLKRWKSILAVTVLCVVVLGGWQWISIKKAHDAGTQTKEEARYTTDLADFQENLANAQGDVNYFTKIWQERVAYRDNSILMNLDPNNVWIAEKKYLVSGAGDSAEEILPIYTGAMTADHDEAEILEVFGTRNAGYARELVKITADNTENSFTVTVWAANEEKARKELAYVSGKIEEAGKKAQAIASHTLKELNEGASQSVLESLISKQSTLQGQIEDDADDINRAKRTLRNVEESRPFEPGDPIARWAITGAVLGFLLMIAIYLTTFLRKNGSRGAGASGACVD